MSGETRLSSTDKRSVYQVWRHRFLVLYISCFLRLTHLYESALETVTHCFCPSSPSRFPQWLTRLETSLFWKCPAIGGWWNHLPSGYDITFQIPSSLIVLSVKLSSHYVFSLSNSFSHFCGHRRL